MDVVFLGATQFSKEMLLCLIQHGIKVKAVFSIPEEFNISYNSERMKNYNYADLRSVSAKHNIDYFEVDSVPGKRLMDYREIFERLKPDLILVLGWYYMIPEKIRMSAKYGAWGIHASLLPRYAGNAPLVWAIVNGEKRTGVTLFKLGNGVDDGDIILQRAFPIAFKDTISNVYEKATIYSKEMIVGVLDNIQNITFTPQDKTKIEVYPPRTHRDGVIDLKKYAVEIYNYIRAQTKPYPGAFSYINGKKIIFWKVRYVENVKYAENLSLKEIFKYRGKIYVKLRNGFLEIIEINYNGKEGEAASIFLSENLSGNKIGS